MDVRVFFDMFTVLPCVLVRSPRSALSQVAGMQGCAGKTLVNGDQFLGLDVRARNPFFLGAECLPSWPPCPEIRTAHAKFTDFHCVVFRISA